jgi:hypothetical protein
VPSTPPANTTPRARRRFAAFQKAEWRAGQVTSYNRTLPSRTSGACTSPPFRGDRGAGSHTGYFVFGQNFGAVLLREVQVVFIEGVFGCCGGSRSCRSRRNVQPVRDPGPLPPKYGSGSGFAPASPKCRRPHWSAPKFASCPMSRARVCSSAVVVEQLRIGCGAEHAAGGIVKVRREFRLPVGEIFPTARLEKRGLRHRQRVGIYQRTATYACTGNEARHAGKW